MADLKAFAEQLVNLTVKEVNELATILKEEYGIEPAAPSLVNTCLQEIHAPKTARNRHQLISKSLLDFPTHLIKSIQANHQTHFKHLIKQIGCQFRNKLHPLVQGFNHFRPHEFFNFCKDRSFLDKAPIDS